MTIVGCLVLHTCKSTEYIWSMPKAASKRVSKKLSGAKTPHDTEEDTDQDTDQDTDEAAQEVVSWPYLQERRQYRRS
jgi:hypothetical protein